MPQVQNAMAGFLARFAKAVQAATTAHLVVVDTEGVGPDAAVDDVLANYTVEYSRLVERERLPVLGWISRAGCAALKNGNSPTIHASASSTHDRPVYLGCRVSYDACQRELAEAREAGWSACAAAVRSAIDEATNCGGT